MGTPSGWSDWNDEARVEWFSRRLSGRSSRSFAICPKPTRPDFECLIQEKWNGLDDDDRVELLIKGPQWMREGVCACVTPEEAARLEELANSRRASMPDDEKIAREELARQLDDLDPTLTRPHSPDGPERPPSGLECPLGVLAMAHPRRGARG